MDIDADPSVESAEISVDKPSECTATPTTPPRSPTPLPPFSPTPLSTSSATPTTPSKRQGEATKNRRYSLRPRKGATTERSEALKKKFNPGAAQRRKTWSTNLETIFEEPITTSNGQLMTVSTRKFKRSISFSQFVNKTKAKKRKIKAKRLASNQPAPVKISMQEMEFEMWKMDLL